ncbi:hypothetical protein ACHAWF_004351 [Thalassiosira exigua]
MMVKIPFKRKSTAITADKSDKPGLSSSKKQQRLIRRRRTLFGMAKVSAQKEDVAVGDKLRRSRRLQLQAVSSRKQRRRAEWQQIEQKREATWKKKRIEAANMELELAMEEFKRAQSRYSRAVSCETQAMKSAENVTASLEPAPTRESDDDAEKVKSIQETSTMVSSKNSMVESEPTATNISSRNSMVGSEPTPTNVSSRNSMVHREPTSTAVDNHEGEDKQNQNGLFYSVHDALDTFFVGAISLFDCNELQKDIVDEYVYATKNKPCG